MAGHGTGLAVRTTLRGFQAVAIVEGGLLPAILLAAVSHWVSGHGATAVAILGAGHGIAFTLYLLLTPFVARLLGWPARTVSVALSVAFIPFAPWAFERRIRPELVRCANGIALHNTPVARQPSDRPGAARNSS